MASLLSALLRIYGLLRPLLIVISVLVIVTYVAAFVSLLASPRWRSSDHGSRELGARQDMEVLANRILFFGLDTGRIPTTEEGLAALYQRPQDIAPDRWDGSYWTKIEVDPWGNPYQYRHPWGDRKSYLLMSMGPDGIPDTDDDIRHMPDSEDDLPHSE